MNWFCHKVFFLLNLTSLFQCSSKSLREVYICWKNKFLTLHPLFFYFSFFQQMVSWTAMAVSNNSTAMTAGGNSTYNATTTTATDTFGGPTNSTSATGAGVSLHTCTFTFLIPFIMAAFLLQSYCWSPEPTAPIFSASTLLLTSHPIIPCSPASLRDHKTNMDGLCNLSTSSLSNAKKYVSQDISFNKRGV